MTLDELALNELLFCYIVIYRYYRTCWTISRTGLYRAKCQNRPFLELEPYTSRNRYLPRNSKYRRDLAVANANGVLVRLICDGLGPG